MSDYKSPSAKRVQRWYALMCRCGLDDTIQEVIQAPVRRRGPVTAADQVDGEEAEPAAVTVDFSRIIREVASDESALFEMVSVVCDCSLKEAEDVPMDAFMEAYHPFVMASVTPISALMGFGAVTQ